MKTCLICSHKADVEAPTCLHCGEASWGAVELPVPVELLPALELEEVPAKGRRGRR